MEITSADITTAEKNGISLQTLRCRVTRGWTVERASTQPVAKRAPKSRGPEFDKWWAVAEMNNIPKHKFLYRIRDLGWTHSKAATTVYPDPELKYVFTGQSQLHKGRTLWRIQSAKDFVNSSTNEKISKGELGGWIGSDENLSHSGTCWVADGAMVYDSAWLSSDAQVMDYAEVYDSADVSGRAIVGARAKVYDRASVRGNTSIVGHSCVYGNACVYGDVFAYGKTRIGGSAEVGGSIRFEGAVNILDNSEINAAGLISGDIVLEGRSYIKGSVTIRNKEDRPLRMYGASYKDCVCFSISNIGSEKGTLTAYRANGTEIYITRGCFSGPLKEFEKRVNRHVLPHIKKEYLLLIPFIKARLKQ